MNDPLEARLFHQIHCCSNLLLRGCHGDGEPHQRRGQGRLLGILLEHEGMSLKEIVHKMDIRPSSAGELVDKLVQQGLVTKRNDGEDKRVYRVYLTGSGREEAQSKKEHFKGLCSELFSGLEAEDMEQLEKLLCMLSDDLLYRYGYIDSKKDVANG